MAQLEELLQKAQEDKAQLRARLASVEARRGDSAMVKKETDDDRNSCVSCNELAATSARDAKRSPDACELVDVPTNSKRSELQEGGKAGSDEALLPLRGDVGETATIAQGEGVVAPRVGEGLGDDEAGQGRGEAPSVLEDALNDGYDDSNAPTTTSTSCLVAATGLRGSMDDGHKFARKWEIAANELHKVRCIGRGAAGAVYEGRWNGGPVAIKQLDDDATHLQHDPKQAEVLLSFRHEVSRMAFLRHPNVVAFFGIVWQPPSLAIVTELAQGDMRGLINACSASCDGAGGLSSLTSRVKAGREACAGLLYLHEQTPPIVHRDVKPENFLVGTDGEIKICDLGLARDLHQTRVHTEHMGGSSIYIAPEVHQGQHFDTGCDVYAMALVSCELLSLERPFHDFPEHMLPGLVGWGAQRPSVASLLELAEARKDRPEGAAIPPLVRAIQSAWAQDPKTRGKLGELFAALEAALRVLDDGNLLRNVTCNSPAGEQGSTPGGALGAPGRGTVQARVSHQVRVMF